MGVFTSTVKSLDSGFEAIGRRISFERVVLYSGFESIGGRISFERAVNGEYLRNEGKRMDGWMDAAVALPYDVGMLLIFANFVGLRY